MPASEGGEWLTFLRGGTRFAVPVAEVARAVERPAEALSPLPVDCPAVKGLLNLFGEIVAVARTPALPAPRARREGTRTYLVLLRADEKVAIEVDELGRIEAAEGDAPPCVRLRAAELFGRAAIR